MLLLFQMGENLYGIDTVNVIEIVPMIMLRKLQPAPDYLAGVFNYHGSIVPVIDLCRLIQGRDCQIRYSTRIVLVNYRIAAEPGSNEQQTQRQLGLMAEHVTETLKLSDEQIRSAERIHNSPYLGELFIDVRGMIQTVNWKPLITQANEIAAWLGGKGHNGAGYSTANHTAYH